MTATKTPRKGTPKWVLYTIASGGALRTHRQTVVSPWKTEFVSDGFLPTPVSETTARNLCTAGYLKPHLSPDWNTMTYEITDKGLAQLEAE